MRIEKACTECGKLFSVKPWELARGRGKFCSLGCRNASYTKKTGEKSVNWKGGKTLDSDGYPMTLIPSHPRARQNGYVLDHILEAEKRLGAPIPDGAVVHHLGHKGDKDNIAIVGSQAEHMAEHARERALMACGCADYRPCKFCHQHDDPANMAYAKSSRAHYHRRCHAIYEKRRRDAIRLRSQESHI